MNIEIYLPVSQRFLRANIPQDWNKLSLGQCISCLEIIDAPTLLLTGESAIFWRQLQIFKALTDWTDEDIQEWQTRDIETGTTVEEWYFMLQQIVKKATDFLFDEDDDGSISIRPGLTQNPIPWFKIESPKSRKNKYYGAHSTEDTPLISVSLNEMTQLFALYESWRSDGDIKHLNQLIAIFYRQGKPATAENIKRNYDGDIREPLENFQSGIDRRADLFDKHWSQKAKRVIAFHIVSCRSKIAELYPSLFSRNGGSTEGGDWLDFILELGDYDITKNASIVMQDAHDALTTAERLVKRNKNKAKQV